MTKESKTAQGWAWDYLRKRLEPITELLGLFENLPKVTTFTDLKEGELFIRFPRFKVENDELVFRNTELYRKIRAVKYMSGPGGYFSAMKVICGLLQEIPDNEPVIMIR